MPLPSQTGVLSGRRLQDNPANKVGFSFWRMIGLNALEINVRQLIALAGCIFIFGCATRTTETGITLRPQLLANNELIYVFSHPTNFAQRDDDKSAEETRLSDLNDWVSDSGICRNGYEIIKRQVVLSRASVKAGSVYYFIKCKS